MAEGNRVAGSAGAVGVTGGGQVASVSGLVLTNTRDFRLITDSS